MGTEKIIMTCLQIGHLFDVILFIITFIICRRGFQRHLDPIYRHVGTTGIFHQDRSVQLMIRTMLYLGAAWTERGRKGHFEGRDPRRDMPFSLRVWVHICQTFGLLIFVFMGATIFYGLATDQLDISGWFSW